PTTIWWIVRTMAEKNDPGRTSPHDTSFAVRTRNDRRNGARFKISEIAVPAVHFHHAPPPPLEPIPEAKVATTVIVPRIASSMSPRMRLHRKLGHSLRGTPQRMFMELCEAMVTPGPGRSVPAM